MSCLPKNDDGVVAGNAITRAGCWSHARRKFVEAENAKRRLLDRDLLFGPRLGESVDPSLYK